MTSEAPGPRDHLLTRLLERRLAGLDPELRSEEPLDPAEGPERLARHAMKQVRRELAAVETAEEQSQQLNALLETLDDGFVGGPARNRPAARTERSAPAPAEILIPEPLPAF